jgi:hypothetical protein
MGCGIRAKRHLSEGHKACRCGYWIPTTRSLGYWLYVVENVGTPLATKLHKINDPAGKAQYYSFDKGWADIAAMG